MKNENFNHYPGTFTFLALQMNRLLDKAETLDLEETHRQIQKNKLFSWLEEIFEGSIDLSLYTDSDRKEIGSFFNGLSSTVDEERKMYVHNNGLCLLIAYCLEGINQEYRF